MFIRAFTPCALLLALTGPCGHQSSPAGDRTPRDSVPPSTPRPGEVVTVRGRLTTEGVECPALRDERDTLYTLAGSIGAFRAGDHVCVRGRIAEVSMCMQGITIAVESIGPASDCP